jgi:hypothetical protein
MIAMKLTHIISIIVLVSGIASCVASSSIFDQHSHTNVSCTDGWDSPSIGRPGACSWHGSVVTRTMDLRNPQQKYVCSALDVLGVLLLLAFPITLIAAIAPSTASPIPPITIQGEAALVSLTISDESRIVKVIRRPDGSYETSETVALVKCPTGSRKGVYRSKIEFTKCGDQFRQNLVTWIQTSRGRAGGYHATAFGWSKDAAPAPQPSE